jgi:DNA-binding NtrC family response regulator
MTPQEAAGQPASQAAPASAAFDHSVWASAAMRHVRETITRIAPTQLPVLLTGESGTGKEIVAREVHRQSQQANQAMVVVDCAAIPPTLMESELFGHVKGAFTGAVQDHRGLVEAAEAGTFFLDEIGELPQPVQVKLLRLLNDGSYRPVGSNEARTARLRVIAATNRNIAEAVEHNRFRADLFHRLNGCQIHLPPLRDRRADIRPLLDLYLKHFAELTGRPAVTLTPEASHLLCAARWPGNVRELVNCAHYIASLAPGPEVRVADLPRSFQSGNTDAGADDGPSIDFSLPYKEAKRRMLDRFEDRYILQLLDRHGGNVSAAARAAGIDRRSIQRMLKRIRDV